MTADNLTLHPCFTFCQRLLGVHGLTRFESDEGVWIMPCRAVHTLGLTQPLDVVFLDARDQILRVCVALAPNRSAWCWRASSVVELPAGFCRRRADYATQIEQQCRAIRQQVADCRPGC